MSTQVVPAVEIDKARDSAWARALAMLAESSAEEITGAIARATAERTALWSKPWLSVSELATYLSMSERTVSRFAERHRLRAARPNGPGSRLLYKRAEVDRALEGSQRGRR